MKKKIIGGLIAAALIGVALLQVVPALADTQVLDHVQLTPTSVTLAVGGAQQFTAQAYDASNAVISSGVSYFWMVLNPAAGIINTSGGFIAGSTPATYTNTVQVVAVQGSVTKIANATVIVTGTAGPLDHVTITPASATLAPGVLKQFSAQAYDASNIAITGLTYTWSVATGAGSILQTGWYTAPTTVGTYTDAVQVSVTQGLITKTDAADVIVVANPTPAPHPNMHVNKLVKMFKGYIRGIGFENFLGGQFQIKNGANTDTIKIIPGVVQTGTTATSLIIIANGQTTPSTFALTADATILPKNSTLAAGDKVIVVTVNDVVKLVYKITIPTGSEGGLMPPGLRKQGDDKREGKDTPPGWSHGRKVGWGMDHGNSEDED